MDKIISSKKKTLGKRKIEMKKIEKKSSLEVTFSKRRMGLFKKASELSVLCGAEIAIIVQSPAGKIFPFSNSSSVESVLQRFFQTGVTTYTSPELERNIRPNKQQQQHIRKLDGEKKIEKKLMESGNNYLENAFWWDLPVENMELHELEGFMEALEGLKSNVIRQYGHVEMIEKQKIAEGSSSSSSSMNLLALECINHEGADEDIQFNFSDLLGIHEFNEYDFNLM